ncbi:MULTISPECIES: hypothetical protein [unclassified Breznakia]|uniref:hypothetical protein n=1 Tax=unclassified Breznakia TaxID=2623764 RepID=UPI00247582E7|nr:MULTISPECIES: hypothetical protein [unclassified Breznakia]MDH6367872.1 hypothetical protein [Breznakia sp. PH1-1]MDH6404960.1 hypothetical protein [Breznakia sp. PF1-11]MDH6412675.1 hypothetical protein [Breznakia sp. PFB1-11]MDH6415022.1 hypothetical protein [Breznakia sp. PFB1-14]MDH6417346.1 hypothetical protein [Breznakia sp. PFB1-4]
MLFKRKQRMADYPDKEKSEIVDEYSSEMSENLLKEWKKVNRKKTIKNWIITLIVLLGVFGGYKSLFSSEKTVVPTEVTDATFVKQYAENYYSYPTSEQSKKYIDKFTINNDESISYSQDVEYVSISNVQIYDVKVLATNSYRYYATASMHTKVKDTDEVTKEICFSIDYIKEGKKYFVVKPVKFVSSSIRSIDEENKSKYKFEPDSSNEQMTDKEKEDVKQTIDLFLKTYNDDYQQAKLLTSGKSVIDKLDPNTKLTLDAIQSTSKDDDTYYITTKVVEEYSDVITMKRSYYFEVSRDKNKITKMEVY